MGIPTTNWEGRVTSSKYYLICGTVSDVDFISLQPALCNIWKKNCRVTDFHLQARIGFVKRGCKSKQRKVRQGCTFWYTRSLLDFLLVPAAALFHFKFRQSRCPSGEFIQCRKFSRSSLNSKCLKILVISGKSCIVLLCSLCSTRPGQLAWS